MQIATGGDSTAAISLDSWSGGADGVRTRDLIDAIDARSQLRYGPTVRLNSIYNTRPAQRQTRACRAFPHARPAARGVPNFTPNHGVPYLT